MVFVKKGLFMAETAEECWRLLFYLVDDLREKANDYNSDSSLVSNVTVGQMRVLKAGATLSKEKNGEGRMLKTLAEKGKILALFTNKPEFVARYILEKLAVADYFSDVAGGGGKFPLKPNPEAMLDFATRRKLSVGEIAMLGDHYTDLEFARRSGAIGVFAAYGFGETRNEKYAFKIDNPLDLLDLDIVL